MTEPVSVRAAVWSRDEDALRELRSEIFVEEQQVPREIEWDGRDAEARHVIAETGDSVVGCGRILSDGRIGRLAVRRELRGSGVGRQLLDALLETAYLRGLPGVYLHAQVSALPFYERAGFAADGEEFMEAGIAHRNMVLQLDYRDRDDDVFPAHYPHPFDQLVIAQAQLARRELAILSPNLDPAVFEGEALAGALRRMLRESRRSRIRILVRDNRSLVQRGHRLLELARRLPSGMELRTLKEHPDWNEDTLVLRDRSAVLAHPGGEGVAGSYRAHDRGRCESAWGRFEELWRVGYSDPEFRALSL